MRRCLAVLLLLAGCAGDPLPRRKPPLAISWEKNILTVKGDFPGGRIDTLYYEAYCRSGARDRPCQLCVLIGQTGNHVQRLQHRALRGTPREVLLENRTNLA